MQRRKRARKASADPFGRAKEGVVYVYVQEEGGGGGGGGGVAPEVAVIVRRSRDVVRLQCSQFGLL